MCPLMVAKVGMRMKSVGGECTIGRVAGGWWGHASSARELDAGRGDIKMKSDSEAT